MLYSSTGVPNSNPIVTVGGNTRMLELQMLYISRLTIVSREAKKKQAVRNEQVSYLHVAPL